MSTPPRSVKIDQNERGAWTSDRPRREGEEERPRRKQDISVRGRVLRPTDGIRYSPGSLLLVTGPDEATIERFVDKVVEERNAVLTLGKLRALLEGKVAEDERDAKAGELRAAVAAKRLAAGDSVVVTVTEIDAEERERWARMAAQHRRPRHLLLIDTKVDDEEVAASLNVLRKALDAGELGAEGFATSMRLSGQAVGERRRIVFAPAPADD